MLLPPVPTALLSDHDLLIVIHTKLEGVFLSIAETRREVAQSAIDHETRIRSLERWVWKALGAIAVFNGIGVALSLLAMYRR